MKKETCDRCGKPCDYPSRLVLLQTKTAVLMGNIHRTHEFDLCDDCARKVFGFVGQLEETPAPPKPGSKVWVPTR